MADKQHNLFLESLARGAKGHQRGSVLGTKKLREGSQSIYHGRHPEDEEYWYGSDRRGIGHGYQELDPMGRNLEGDDAEPEPEQMGSYSTDDNRFARQSTPRMGSIRDLMARRRAARPAPGAGSSIDAHGQIVRPHAAERGSAGGMEEEAARIEAQIKALQGKLAQLRGERPGGGSINSMGEIER